MKKKSPNLTISDTNLKNAVKSYQRDEVIWLLKQNAFDLVPENEKAEVCQNLIALRSMTIMDFFAKKLDTFTPEMIQMDFSNWQNREFVKKVLDKYLKKFDLKTEETCTQLMSIACAVDSTSTAQYLVRQKKALSCCPMLGSASASMFQTITQISPSDLNADLTVELILAVTATSQSIERLDTLKALGYDLETKNSEGENAASLLSQKISKGKYPKNRNGELLRSKDKQTLQYLKRPERANDQEKKSFFTGKKLAVCMIAGALIVICGAYGIGYQVMNSDSQTEASTEVSETDTLETTETDTAAAEESTVDYNTDTNLVVADGDVVNIDYIGYVDR